MRRDERRRADDVAQPLTEFAQLRAVLDLDKDGPENRALAGARRQSGIRETEHSFGLTTLRNDHVRIYGGRVVLDFRGKHGILHHKVVADAKLARILEHCHDLPGAELFKYFDEAGQLRHVSSEDVNRYLREITGRHITAKDFRT
jgi:DNA topoisomerase IB